MLRWLIKTLSVTRFVSVQSWLIKPGGSPTFTPLVPLTEERNFSLGSPVLRLMMTNYGSSLAILIWSDLLITAISQEGIISEWWVLTWPSVSWDFRKFLSKDKLTLGQICNVTLYSKNWIGALFRRHGLSTSRPLLHFRSLEEPQITFLGWSMSKLMFPNRPSSDLKIIGSSLKTSIQFSKILGVSLYFNQTQLKGSWPSLKGHAKRSKFGVSLSLI